MARSSGPASSSILATRKKDAGTLRCEVNVCDSAHAVQEFGDVFGRVAEASLAPLPIPPGEYTLRVIGGHIVGHHAPLFRLGRE